MIKIATMESIINSFFNPEYLFNNEEINYSNDLIYFLKENKIFIRYIELLENNNLNIDKKLRSEYEKEVDRVKINKDMINNIVYLLKEYEENYILFKNYQHYPDMGEDIDILITNNYSNIKYKLIKEYNLIEKKQSIFNKIARKNMLLYKDKCLEIELHNARLGRLGEFIITKNIIEYCKKNKDMIYVPSAEFQLVINVVQRLYTRSHLRISEIIFNLH